MTRWETFQLLCRCLAGDGATLQACTQTGAFDAVLAMAGERDLVHTLAVRLETQPDLAAGLSTASRETLGSALAWNTRHQMHLKAQALKAARTLNAAGVEPVFLKGTALMWADGAPPVGYRKQTDIDLLLAPEQLLPASRALLDDGYYFCDYNRPVPELFTDAARALRLSAYHHHLPPMVKEGQHATLELHRHPLPRRFQRRLPLSAFLAGARRIERHGSSFRTASPSAQRLALVYAAFLHDSGSARFDFPLRAGLDYLELQRQETGEAPPLPAGSGDEIRVFEALLARLMQMPTARAAPPCDIGTRLRLMRWRMNSPLMARALDTQARARHLASTLWYSSGKLPGYMQRKATGLLAPG